MARRGLTDLVKPIADSAALDAWIEKSEKILVVMDVHKNWCGPCEVMKPTFERIFLELDQAESRIAFVSVDTSLLTEEQLKALEVRDGCKPMFLVYKHKAKIGKVEGVNAPELATLITDNVFPIREEE